MKNTVQQFKINKHSFKRKDKKKLLGQLIDLDDLDKDMQTQGEEISFQKVIFNSTIVSVPESWFIVKLGSR